MQYIQPLKAKGYKLVSPAFTYGGAPAGIAWMDAFVAACTGCTFDAVGMYMSLASICQYSFVFRTVSDRRFSGI